MQGPEARLSQLCSPYTAGMLRPHWEMKAPMGPALGEQLPEQELVASHGERLGPEPQGPTGPPPEALLAAVSLSSLQAVLIGSHHRAEVLVLSKTPCLSHQPAVTATQELPATSLALSNPTSTTASAPGEVLPHAAYGQHCDIYMYTVVLSRYVGQVDGGDGILKEETPPCQGCCLRVTGQEVQVPWWGAGGHGVMRLPVPRGQVPWPSQVKRLHHIGARRWFQGGVGCMMGQPQLHMKRGHLQTELQGASWSLLPGPQLAGFCLQFWLTAARLSLAAPAAASPCAHAPHTHLAPRACPTLPSPLLLPCSCFITQKCGGGFIPAQSARSVSPAPPLPGFPRLLLPVLPPLLQLPAL